MTQRIARHDSLFSLPATEGALPTIFVGRCTCGHVFFPPHRFGCEACGAGSEGIEIIELAARGTLKAFAISHLETHPDGGRPYIVGEVLLDDGPVISVVLETRDEKALSIGRPMIGKLVASPETSQGQIFVDCLFAPEGGAL